jgi:hypothetical protein
MVKASRDQSQDAPRRFSCWRMVPPDCAFHAQTWDRNSSRLSRGAGSGIWHQLAFHDHLRGDARMVRARLPERVEAAHPVPAGQHVLQRVVEGMAHMQDAGHVGRRDHDRKRLGPGSGVRARLEGVCLFPGGIDTGLGLLCVEGLVHGFRASRLSFGLT